MFFIHRCSMEKDLSEASTEDTFLPEAALGQASASTCLWRLCGSLDARSS